LLRLGRLDEARRELDEVVSREESYAPAVRDLCIVELLAGNLSAAEDLADRLARLAPRDPFAWELGGLVALESGELEEADRRFARACDLGGEIAGARAGRALVAIARGERLEEAALWIELARSQEPSSPLVLLAEAGWRQGRGELEEAYVRFAEAVLRLQEQGRYGWIPFHEKFGRRWGLLEAAGGKPAE
jgi:Flp pilus assembly protein TadD